MITCAASHPFFSVDRNSYIAVDELQLGEQVMTAGEKVVKFIAGKLRDKGEPVYNFEVWREHNYYVSSKESAEWFLVHNNCFPDDKNIFKLFNVAKDKWHKHKETMIKVYSKKDKNGILFTNKNGEKWPYRLGDNPDVGVSDYGHLLFRSRSEPTKIWNTFEDAEKWVE